MTTVVPEPGDVRTRLAPLCSHGHKGYCAEDALPGEREAAEYLHRAAFAYAEPRGRELAEDFASWLLRRAWHPGVLIMEWDLPREFERFQVQLDTPTKG